MLCGRTLFGAKPPKGQELEDHYFGTIKPRVASFMADLDKELWKLGIFAKTEHNEVAPAQHELAPVFADTNLATDHNQLTMETMKKVAKRHGLTCLLHEKPFEGINGSGKHNNWSISTNTGTNLLEPGDSPQENAQFLLFLTAVIKAVDEYQDLLRVSVATAGNDHRLGANEAPPAIISMFLGDDLTEILEAIESDTSYNQKDKEVLKVGVHILPRFPKDTTDRNRTSPFAFTGNKFEFRMLGSDLSIAGPNIILNTIVAEELSQFADILEQTDDFNKTLQNLIKKTISEHKRIIFNGNNYSDEWVAEAKKRGLLNLETTADALPSFIAEKNIKLFTKHKIFTTAELHSRFEILMELYTKKLNIEALTMVDMTIKQILPAISKYTDYLSKTALNKKKLSEKINIDFETNTVLQLSEYASLIYKEVSSLQTSLEISKTFTDISEQAMFYKNDILSCMNKLRSVVDIAETLTAKEYWPLPSYTDLLYSI